MRIVLCDDNPEDIARHSVIIKELIREKTDIELVSYESTNSLLFNLDGNLDSVDILIMEVLMPCMKPYKNGMDMVKSFRNQGYDGLIIFLTRSKEYEHMQEAFDVNAFHYIVKGRYSKDKIVEVLSRAIVEAAKRAKESFTFIHMGAVKNIPVDAVKYFEVNGKIITVHYSNKTYEFLSTIGKVEDMALSKGFIRIHRSYLVALRAIRKINYSELVLVDDSTLPVGRKYINDVKAKWSERISNRI